ncbi:two-component regulator propeller domain-containing protein [Niabella aquatica]
MGTRNGLSSLKINNTIVQDDKGFIWVGTEDGLNKFDGHSFTVYKNIRQDTTSIVNNIITALYIDSRGRLWVASMSGLQYYDDRMDNFKSVYLGQDRDMFRRHPVKWIMEDAKKNLWFGVEDKGALQYPLNGQKPVWLYAKSGPGYLQGHSIRSIVGDNEGNIWFATFDKGISVYNPADNSFIHYNAGNNMLPTDAILGMVKTRDGNILISTLGRGIYRYEINKYVFEKLTGDITAFTMQRISNGDVLIGTEDNGLLYFDQTDKTVKPYPGISDSRPGMENSKIHGLFEDRNGNLWIGYYNDGIGYLRKEPFGFTSYKKGWNDQSKAFLSYGQVSAITTDRSGNIWFATDGGGLSRYNKLSGTYTHYRHQPQNSRSLPDNAVVSVFCDSRGVIWAGTYSGGLCRFDSTSGTFLSYSYQPGAHSISGNYVKCIVEDARQNFWLGLDGTGISYFDSRSGTFKNYQTTAYPDLINNFVTNLYLQGDSVLWIGSHTGICKMDIRRQIFTSFENEPSIKFQTIYAIAEDAAHQIWVGTSSGLYQYEPENNAFIKHRLISQGNFDVAVNGIVPYNNQLWLSANTGIICYDPLKRKIGFYISNNDLGGINFIRSSYYISPRHEVFFGGGSGCYSFFPDRVPTTSFRSVVHITGLQIFNKPVPIGKRFDGRIVLHQSLAYTKKIGLKYNENSITIFFASPLVAYPASTNYRCMMEGVDKEWRTLPEGQLSVSYAHLPPGDYAFRIGAGNVSGDEPDNISVLHISIQPPLWLTWWVKLFYVLAAILLLFMVFRVLRSRMIDRHTLALEKLKRKKQEELNQNKMQFFTNISHELRTPLTLILSPLSEMKQGEKNKDRTAILDMMIRNANRLLRLINQILDLRKIEDGKMEVHTRLTDIVSYTEQFTKVFGEIMQRRHISFSFESNTVRCFVNIDPELMENCLYNLFANAIRFTPEGGNIGCKIELVGNKDKVLVTVWDTGVGIPANEIPFLFDRFYQGSGSQKSGTGIGLHLVKNIVALHHGMISVSSAVGKGTSFEIEIPTASQDTVSSAGQNMQLVEAHPALLGGEGLDLSEPEAVLHAKLSLLLVEDEDDMATYLYHQLKNDYYIIKVSNGKDALEKVKTHEPDLILSDVMMPEMDGVELCKSIKENMNTCHIPVVLLTANDTLEKQLEGLETGADAYIIKPFFPAYLSAVIKSLIQGRKKMRQRSAAMLQLEAKNVEIVNEEEQLLQSCINYIRDNMDEPVLNVEDISKKMNMSRTSLHRKIKVMTGSSPVELIKTIRMKQAAMLLEKSNVTVSEVAYQVGYSSLSYFSSAFNNYWGISPTQYQKTKRQQ